MAEKENLEKICLCVFQSLGLSLNSRGEAGTVVCATPLWGGASHKDPRVDSPVSQAAGQHAKAAFCTGEDLSPAVVLF